MRVPKVAASSLAWGEIMCSVMFTLFFQHPSLPSPPLPPSPSSYVHAYRFHPIFAQNPHLHNGEISQGLVNDSLLFN